MQENILLRALACSCLAATARAQVLNLDILGAAPNAEFGYDIAVLDDLDGDGSPEFLSSAPGIGHSYVYSGRTGALRRSHVGTQALEKFGSAVAKLGDLNGDGVAEYAVGSPTYQSLGVFAGRVTVYSGRSGAVLFTLDGDVHGEGFGWGIAGLGDLDTDGIQDFAVGSPYSSTIVSSGGRVRVFSGASQSMLFDLDGTSHSRYWGWHLADAGDVDGDGIPDVLSGSPFEGSGFTRVFSGANGVLLLEIPALTPNERSGFVVRGMGDIDGDGHADVLTAAPSTQLQTPSGTEFQVGSIRICSGNTGATLVRVDGVGPFDNFGGGAGSAGDYDGDGALDFVGIGASNEVGRVRVFSGATGTLLRAFPVALSIASGGSGAVVAGGTDFDLDGQIDFLVGNHRPPFNTNQGRVIVLDGRPAVGTVYCSQGFSETVLIHGQGSAVVTDNDVTLLVEGLFENSFGYFLTSLGNQVIPNPGGTFGSLCLGAPTGIGRYASVGAGMWGRIQSRLDLSAVPTPTGATPALSGQTRNWQLWYRHGNIRGFSNALGITLQ